MVKSLLAVSLFMLSCFHCLAGDTTSVQVRFAFNKHSLDNDAKLQLDDVKPVDSTITLTNIKIYGYTDQIGGNDYNEKLSLKRATEVRNYLIKSGIDASIITIVKGKGETELMVNAMDEESRQQNRRVLVMIEYEAKVIEQTIIIKSSKKKDSTERAKEKPKEEPQTLAEKIKDSKVKAGDNITLPNINFVGGRHVFLPQSQQGLTELLNTMKEIPTLTIEIQGHICCEIGPIDGVDMDLGTRDLSVQRARAVYLYLFKNGIDVGRMSYKGFGHRYPINDEETESEKTANRRVEIKVLSK